MKKLEALILGQNYPLSCSDDEYEYLQEATKLLNLRMCDIREQGKIRSRETIAILVSVEIIIDLIKANHAKDNALAAYQIADNVVHGEFNHALEKIDPLTKHTMDSSAQKLLQELQNQIEAALKES